MDGKFEDGGVRGVGWGVDKARDGVIVVEFFFETFKKMISPVSNRSCGPPRKGNKKKEEKSGNGWSLHDFEML